MLLAHLADPDVIDESIQITRHALRECRRLRARGEIDDMADKRDVVDRVKALESDCRRVLRAIDMAIRQPYSADGLYEVFVMGFLPVPYLWEGRKEFACDAYGED